jgi:hypothetical protein
METGIRILYHGKPLSSFEKTEAPDEEELLTVAVAQDVEAALEPLRAKIEEEGGEVTVNLKSPSRFEISAKRMSDELKQQVMKAVTPPDQK